MQAAEQVKETVVAVLPGREISGEQELSKSVTAVEFQAESIIIETDDDYKEAAEFGRAIKRKAAEVVAFFKPMKEAANKAHKEVCDREKTMLAPLKSAEKTLKYTMGKYLDEQERKRRELEEQMRRKAQEEAERKLEEAVAAEESGDRDKSNAAMLDATMLDQMSRSSAFEIERPKADGVSAGKDWEIVEIDQIAVPLSVQGVCIRPVDEKAVMRLIRASKGSIQIPGVIYREMTKMSFRK